MGTAAQHARQQHAGEHVRDDGQIKPWTHLAAPAGHVEGTIPLALNEKPGTWKLVARDVATGTTEAKNVKLREAR